MIQWLYDLQHFGIKLGLHNIRGLLEILGQPESSFARAHIAGTNGKGSVVAYCDAMLRASGYRVGTYTSPHLQRYNERIHIDGAEASDQALCEAFSAIDAARGDIPLTYFEFGTLAALWLCSRAGLDAAVLEVGLGGRLDAVNLVDPDLAMVTSVDLDHQDWLGDDRAAIGFDKAGIFRTGIPAACGDPQPPASPPDQAAAIGAQLPSVGRAVAPARRRDYRAS